MRCVFRILACICILLVAALFGQARGYGSSVPEASAPCCIYCGARMPGPHAPGCPYAAQTAKAPASKKVGHSTNMNTMLMNTVFETLLTSLFSDNSANQKAALAAKQKAAQLAAQQAAALEHERAKAAQAAYERMMKSYKMLGGYQDAKLKTLSDTNLNFKGLNGDTETLSANAGQPFDTALQMRVPPSGPSGAPTAFFGDTMPIEDIRFLVNPENDPNLVDLRNAKTFVVENLKKDSEKLAVAAKRLEQNERGGTTASPPACEEIARKLEGFVHQRQQFQKTILLAQAQVDTWKTANRNALLNAAKDGMSYFVGNLLEKFTQRAKAADRLQQICQENADGMAREGVDIAAIQRKITRLKMLSAPGEISSLASNMNDWQGFIKDGMSSLMVQMRASNHDIAAILEDPKLGKYFETEAPALKALLDLSKIAVANKVFGKWVAKKIPLIAGVELAINETYNATDWFLSYKRIAEANKINGRVLEAARSIQQHIENNAQALKKCR